MLKYYIIGIKKFVDFEGRARRKEFWVFVLVHVAISLILLTALFIFIATAVPRADVESITLLCYLFAAIPVLAATCRRLHDIGKSGWWIFIQAIPLIGPIWHFVNMVSDSEPGDNQYGPNPKQQSASK